MNLNPYEVLGVSAEARPEIIREAYKIRVKETHPDRGGDPQEFIRVQEAYKLLKMK